jgi:hypothetical protein
MGKPADFSDILNGVMWSQVVLGTVLVALRMYTRQYIVRNVGWDDVLMLVNLVRSPVLFLVPSNMTFPSRASLLPCVVNSSS